MPAESRELTDTVVAVTGASSGIGMYGGILDRSDHDLQTMIRTNVEGTVWAVCDPALDDYLPPSTTTYKPKTSPTPSPPCYPNRDGSAPPNGNCGAWDKAVDRAAAR